MKAHVLSQNYSGLTDAKPNPLVTTKFLGIKIKNDFENINNFEDWNCGKITICGDHQICGGYNVKGKGSYITKTFMLPAGKYSLQLDFIKIDSWCVCGREQHVIFGMLADR